MTADVAEALLEVLAAFERALVSAAYQWRGWCAICERPIFGLRAGATTHPSCAETEIAALALDPNMHGGN